MDDIIPLKRVAANLGISRSSLWRACKSNIPDVPPPLVVRGRVYWRRSDLPELEAALARYPGRVAFERECRHAKARVALAEAIAASARRKRIAKRRVPDVRQPDLFGAADSLAPAGAEGAD
ncbi:MAG: hypothetical protein ABL864_10960 [Terricaulis sp.]